MPNENLLFPGNPNRKPSGRAREANQLLAGMHEMRQAFNALSERGGSRPRRPETGRPQPAETQRTVGKEALRAASPEEHVPASPTATEEAEALPARVETPPQDTHEAEPADLDEVIPGTNLTKRDIVEGGGTITSTTHPSGTKINVVNGSVDLRDTSGEVVFGITRDPRRS